jgi:hypothetical protein
LNELGSRTDKESDIWKQDVAWTAANLGNLKGLINIEDPMFTHMDFAWSTKVVDLLYSRLFEVLPEPI